MQKMFAVRDFCGDPNIIYLLFWIVGKEYEGFNALLEKEYVGYRFIQRMIAPITDEIEMKAIEDAFTIKYQGIELYGVLERKEYNDDIRAVCETEIQAWEQTFLEQRILRKYGRAQQASRAEIYTKPRERRYDKQPDRLGGVI